MSLVMAPTNTLLGTCSGGGVGVSHQRLPGRRRAPRASAEASSGPKPAQMAPVGSYRQARYLLRLLERVLKVLGGLTTPDWQVGQHRLQVRGSDGAQPGQVGASARWHRNRLLWLLGQAYGVLIRDTLAFAFTIDLLSQLDESVCHCWC